MNLEEYLKARKKTHLIFDLDETLVRLILPWDKWGKDIEDELRKVDGKILNDYQKEKINLSQLENLYVEKLPQILDLLIKNAIEFETENLKDIQVNHRLVDFIKNAKGYQLFIWSSNSKSTVKTVLKKVRLDSKFKITARDDVTFIKPEIDGFNLIWDQKTPKGDYLFVGDSSADEQAAKSAGIDFFKVDYFQ